MQTRFDGDTESARALEGDGARQQLGRLGNVRHPAAGGPACIAAEVRLGRGPAFCECALAAAVVAVGQPDRVVDIPLHRRINVIRVGIDRADVDAAQHRRPVVLHGARDVTGGNAIHRAACQTRSLAHALDHPAWVKALHLGIAAGGVDRSGSRARVHQRLRHRADLARVRVDALTHHLRSRHDVERILESLFRRLEAEQHMVREVRRRRVGLADRHPLRYIITDLLPAQKEVFQRHSKAERLVRVVARL